MAEARLLIPLLIAVMESLNSRQAGGPDVQARAQEFIDEVLADQPFDQAIQYGVELDIWLHDKGYQHYEWVDEWRAEEAG